MQKNKRLTEAERLIAILGNMFSEIQGELYSEKLSGNLDDIDLQCRLAKNRIEHYFNGEPPKTTKTKVYLVNGNRAALMRYPNGDLTIASIDAVSKKGSQAIRDEIAEAFESFGVTREAVMMLRGGNKVNSCLSYSAFISDEVAERGLPDGYIWIEKNKFDQYYPKGSDELKKLHLAILYAGCYHRQLGGSNGNWR